MIIIRPRPGETITDVLRLLRDLVDDVSTVRTGGGGAIVGEELAYDYLTAILNKAPVVRLGQLAVDPAAEPASGTPQDPAPIPPTPAVRPGPRRQARKTAAKTPGGVS